jgi:hypothetical protein
MSMEREPENPVNRALLDIIKARAAAGESGPVDLDAAMETAGGEAAAQWRATKVSQRAWTIYYNAEQAYWDIQDLRYLMLHTVATLRMAETALLKTDLTTEHREHGWSEGMVEYLASRCAEFREQVESEAFANPQAGYELGRAKLEEVSPKWWDTDELSVALDHAGRMLDILGQRLKLDPPKKRYYQSG